MILEKITSHLEERYPKKNSEDWDNVGLMLGDRKSEIKKILIALDADRETVEYAVENKIDLLITHHPFIFNPIRNITSDSILGKKIFKLIKNNINLYSIHTNIDSSKSGLNDFLLEKLGIDEGRILSESLNCSEVGIGRYFKLEENIYLKKYVELVKNRLNLEQVFLYSSENPEIKKIKKIAVINGAGASFWKKAKFIGCDLIITGDVKYHDALDALESGISLIDIGHYESEKIFMELVEKKIKELPFEGEILKYEKTPIWRIV